MSLKWYNEKLTWIEGYFFWCGKCNNKANDELFLFELICHILYRCIYIINRIAKISFITVLDNECLVFINIRMLRKFKYVLSIVLTLTLLWLFICSQYDIHLAQNVSVVTQSNSFLLIYLDKMKAASSCVVDLSLLKYTTCLKVLISQL